MRATIITALVLLALFVAYPYWQDNQQAIGEDRATARANAATQAQNKEAAALLAAEKERADAATKALRDFTATQEKTDANVQEQIALLERRLRAAAGAAGRLRDPYAVAASGPGCAGAPGAGTDLAGNSAGDTAQAHGLLSPELSGFLIAKLTDAERINAAYASCRAIAGQLKEALP